MHVPGEESEKRRLETPDEVCAVLEEDFGIDIPDRERLIGKLQALA